MIKGNRIIEVRIFDISGKLIDLLAGKENVIWHANDLQPGIYFIEIKQGNLKRIAKAIKIQ